MESVEIDLAIIGGGVTGLATAYKALEAMTGKSVAVFEKNKFLGEEQSGRNSGVVHGGMYYRPGSKKAINCVWGNKELYSFCLEHGVAIARTEKIIVATTPEERILVEELWERGTRNGVPGLEMITGEEVRRLEPNVKALCALYSPTTGIVDAAAYLKTLEKLVKKRGGMIFTDTTVEAIFPAEDRATLWVKQGDEEYEVRANYVVNAAGLHADVVGRMINPDFPYQIKPLRGEYMKFNRRTRPELWLNGLNVYPAPRIIPEMFDQDGKPKRMVGTHLTPVFEYDREGKAQIGNTILVGPLGHVVDSKEDYTSKRHGKEEFLHDVTSFLSGLAEDDLEEDQVGIQAKLVSYDDFVLENDRRYRNCIHAIPDSPGLTASLANAVEIIGLIRGKRKEDKIKSNP